MILGTVTPWIWSVNIYCGRFAWTPGSVVVSYGIYGENEKWTHSIKLNFNDLRYTLARDEYKRLTVTAN